MNEVIHTVEAHAANIPGPPVAAVRGEIGKSNRLSADEGLPRIDLAPDFALPRIVLLELGIERRARTADYLAH